MKKNQKKQKGNKPSKKMSTEEAVKILGRMTLFQAITNSLMIIYFAYVRFWIGFILMYIIQYLILSKAERRGYDWRRYQLYKELDVKVK